MKEYLRKLPIYIMYNYESWIKYIHQICEGIGEKPKQLALEKPEVKGKSSEINSMFTSAFSRLMCITVKGSNQNLITRVHYISWVTEAKIRNLCFLGGPATQEGPGLWKEKNCLRGSQTSTVLPRSQDFLYPWNY